MDKAHTCGRALAAAVLVLTAVTAPRAWPGDGARIVFGAATRDGKKGIYITTPQGDGFKELTDHRIGGIWPAWSHDGRSIAFAHSPLGLHRSIYLMDPDGDNVRMLSRAAGGGDWYPTWSPRDDAIAFTSSRRHGLGSRTIYVADLASGAETLITDPDTWALGPSWSPVGDTIAYASGNAHLDIHIMDRAGTPLAQLTDRPRVDWQPSWHPRGKLIAFVSGGEDSANLDIHTRNSDGAGERRLTMHPADDRTPVWSPDGTQILFDSLRDGVGGLFIMTLEGRIVRKVTDERLAGRVGATLVEAWGASWHDPAVPRSVSPVGRHATTWGWLKRLGAPGL